MKEFFDITTGRRYAMLPRQLWGSLSAILSQRLPPRRSNPGTHSLIVTSGIDTSGNESRIAHMNSGVSTYNRWSMDFHSRQDHIATRSDI